ncbi:MAG TPA: hypothetical protein PKC72_01570 [Chitinophagaceae bacterium]|nr:hypothetical protein [Chitinophagaceae bacterium]
MVEDLRLDINAINKLNPIRLEKHRTYDSLTKSVFTKSFLGNGSDFYYWARIISRQISFVSTDGTIQQLKNSGGLRLIHNKAIRDSILSYDLTYKNILYGQELENSLLKDYRDMASKIFDAAVFNEMFLKSYDFSLSADNYIIYMERPGGNPQLRKNSDELVNEMLNKAMYWFVASNSLYQINNDLKLKAERLILLIQKHYHTK